MADVARYSDNIGNMVSPVPLANTAPEIHMMPNPDFSFPRIPPCAPILDSSDFSAAHKRTKSMGWGVSELRAGASHRRGISVASAAMPSFSFNPADMSGRSAEEPEIPLPTTPSRSTGHKRQSSALVGGHGIADAISTSPTRSTALPVPRRRHGRDNSRVTLSGQEWSRVMAEADQAEPRLSSSLPNTPLEHRSQESLNDHNRSFSNQGNFSGAVSDELTVGAERPSSRPRVEFSDNVEYIPRPLSTISSETGSSISTVRGHSVNNSITSVLSMNAPSPSSLRARSTSLETTPEDEPRKLPRSSIDISKRTEKEGQWLRHGSLRDSSQPASMEPEQKPTSLTFSAVESTKKAGTSHRKRQSIGHALGFDRRRSEPAIGNYADEPSRLSALSLQETGTEPTMMEADAGLSPEPRSSSRKIKDWALSKMMRRSRPNSVYLLPPHHAQAPDASPISEPAVAETDLDTVFSLDADDMPSGSVRIRPAVTVHPTARHTWSSSRYPDNEDFGTMLDLDAALGPHRTPGLAEQKPRRELHSSRGTRDFGGPGGHYQPSPNHRRTESAPMLTPFDFSRTTTPPQASMADVFEEDEEEEDGAATNQKHNSGISTDDEAGTGIAIVESAMGANSCDHSLSVDDGLRIQNSQSESERSGSSYNTLTSRLSAPTLNRRSSVIEDTIVEEGSPVESTASEAVDEPRASSLTKSSESSETPTLVGAQTGLLTLPDAQSTTTATPETYYSSEFSSPDFGQRLSSFEASRVGTSASSMTDNRTISSCTTGGASQDVRTSIDDVPSLTSSRSTMMSSLPANSSRRDVSSLRTPSTNLGGSEAKAMDQRRKRNSIQSLSQLMSGSFGSRPAMIDGSRPQTAIDGLSMKAPKKKEYNRLKKLMFWKSKHRQSSSTTIP